MEATLALGEVVIKILGSGPNGLFPPGDPSENVRDGFLGGKRSLGLPKYAFEKNVSHGSACTQSAGLSHGVWSPPGVPEEQPALQDRPRRWSWGQVCLHPWSDPPVKPGSRQCERERLSVAIPGSRKPAALHVASLTAKAIGHTPLTTTYGRRIGPKPTIFV